MKNSIKSILCILIVSVFLPSCAFTPQQIAKKAIALTEDSTVRLINRDEKSRTVGTGFFVDKDKIATNIHVVGQPGPIFAKLSENETILAVEGVAAFDVKNNLVILKIAGKGSPLPIGDSDAVHIGESISVVGYSDEKYKAELGTIASIQRSNKWFEVKASAFKESSGGPLLNSKGQVIGITVAYGDASENYAIPSNTLKALLAKTTPLESLVEWQKRPYISAELYHSQGEGKSTAKEYKNAIVDFDKVIALNPEHVRAYYKRGLTKYNLENYAGAIDDYTRVIKLNPRHARAYNNRGVAKFRLSESKHNSGDVEKAQLLYQEAIDDYTRAIKLNPRHATAYNNRGIVKSILGDIESESGDAERAQRLYHEGVVDYGKSVQLKYTEDTNAPTAHIKSKGIASTVNVIKWTGSTYFGSGFFVDKDKIATNIHVVARPGPVYVKLINNETIWEVEEVTAFDVDNDIVVLKISGKGTPLPLGDSSTIQIGESVVTVGYPSNKYEVTKGKVHNIRNKDKWIVTTANIGKGGSGGPLLNSKGEVIGINTHGTESGNHCISVPSNILKALLSQSVSSEPLVQWQQREQIRAYAYYVIGQDYCIAGNYSKALINFEKAILYYPIHYDIYDWRGRTRHNLGKSKAEQGDVDEAQKLYKAAIQDYTYAIKIDPENASPFHNRGNVKHDLGESKAEQGDIAEAQKLYNAAIQDYTNAIKIAPEDASTFYNRGNAKYVLGESKAEQGGTAEAQKLYNAAIQDYTNAIKLNPEDAGTFNNRGVAKYVLGKSKAEQGEAAEAQKLYNAAIQDCTNAIKLNPEDAGTFNNRGAAKYFLGESKAEQGGTAEAQKLYKAAIQDYTNAIKLNPEDAGTFNNRGVAKKALGQHEAAEKDFAKAKELKSEK